MVKGSLAALVILVNWFQCRVSKCAHAFGHVFWDFTRKFSGSFCAAFIGIICCLLSRERVSLLCFTRYWMKFATTNWYVCLPNGINWLRSTDWWKVDEDGTQKKWTFTQQHCGVKQELQVSIVMGIPDSWLVEGKSPSKMDDGWGYPHVWNPPKYANNFGCCFGIPLGISSNKTTS